MPKTYHTVVKSGRLTEHNIIKLIFLGSNDIFMYFSVHNILSGKGSLHILGVERWQIGNTFKRNADGPEI